jgi:hypothetical protein
MPSRKVQRSSVNRGAVYDPRMRKRGLGVTVLAALVVLGLAGCQASSPGALTRSGAQSDVATWTHDAETALGSPKARVQFDGFEACRTDHSYFTTSSEWRTVTLLSVPKARQAAAITALSADFVARNWSTATSNGFVNLSGPKNARHRGLVRIERDGDSMLAITVISPCYT